MEKNKNLASHIQKHLAAIWEQGEVREIRAFDAKEAITFGYFDSPENAAKAVSKIIGSHVIYFTLNPCKPALLARAENRLKLAGKKTPTTSDKDVACLKYLLVDIDPVRPAGISSSYDELMAARDMAEKVIAKLGNPRTFGCSGNGAQLLYRHNAKNPEQLKAFLASLAKDFDNDVVQIDCAVFNPARICKVLGTWARKGDNTKERPHRQSFIEQVYNEDVVLDIPAIQEQEQEQPKRQTMAKVPSATKSEPQNDQQFDVRAFLTRHNVGIAKEKNVDGGRTMLILQGGCVFDSSHAEGEASICVHSSGAVSYQCFHDSCKEKTWQDFKALLGLESSGKATCKRCGFDGTWKKMEDGSWKIATQNGRVHKCAKKSAQKEETTSAQNGDEIPQRKNAIYEMDGKTYIVKAYGKGENVEYSPCEMASFVMEIRQKVVADNGDVSWQIALKTSNEEEHLEMDGNVLGSVAQFTDAIMKRGCFLYNVTDKPTHNLFIAYAMSKGNIPQIQKTQYLGMLDQGFLFHNAFVQKGTGHVIPINESSIQPPKPEKKLREMVLSMEGNPTSIMADMFENMYSIMDNQAWKVLGFSLATLFSDSIFKTFSMFPLLFVWGRRTKGKSSIGGWISSLFGLHGCLTPFNINSTQKAIQRTGAKYINCPVLLNEFKSSEQSLALLTSLFDREGYGRASKDNTLDSIQGEINATFAIISTQNFMGIKAEDVQSRVVVFDANQSKKDEKAFAWLQANKDLFSCFVEYCMGMTSSKEITRTIKETMDEIRLLCPGCNERIIATHSIFAACYNVFVKSFGHPNIPFERYGVTPEQIANEIKKHCKNTDATDMGVNFLNILTSMIHNGVKISPTTAQIQVQNTGENSQEVLYFAIDDVFTFVREQGIKSAMPTADKASLEAAFRELGCEKLKKSRILDARRQRPYWKYIIPDGEND
jgi:hypothetical protein